MSIVGRPPYKLIDGDTALTPKDLIPGTVAIVNGAPYVTWSDRTAPEVLKGGMVKTLRRPGEILDWERERESA